MKNIYKDIYIYKYVKFLVLGTMLGFELKRTRIFRRRTVHRKKNVSFGQVRLSEDRFGWVK